jgi:hypothetical protein
MAAGEGSASQLTDPSRKIALGVSTHRGLAAAGDGLGLVSVGEWRYREYSRQCYEQAECGFTHFLLLIAGVRCRFERSLIEMRETEAWLRELWLLRGAPQCLAGLKRELQCRIGLAARTAASTTADVPSARKETPARSTTDVAGTPADWSASPPP